MPLFVDQGEGEYRSRVTRGILCDQLADFLRQGLLWHRLVSRERETRNATGALVWSASCRHVAVASKRLFMTRRNARFLTTWLALVALRLLVALSSRSSIHPDEHFQNPEIAAGLVYDYVTTGGQLLRTWEWDPASPCRSIVPVASSTGFGFAVSKWLGYQSE